MPSKIVRNLTVIGITLAVTGIARLPMEQAFTEDLRERKLVPPRLTGDVWGEMSQTSLAGTLGGLRTVMASMVSLGAYSHFEDDEWGDLKRDYEIATSLDPYNAFYWNHGGWHLGLNATSWAANNQDFSPTRRRIMEKQYLEEADTFYRRGLEFLPEEDQLWMEMGRMWKNPYRQPDLNRAAEAYAQIRDARNPVFQRTYLFTLARIPGREIEAYDEALRLLDNPRHREIPTFRVLLMILSTNPDLPKNSLPFRLGEVFPSLEVAYMDLFNYRFRVKEEGFYEGKLDELLRELIVELNVPDHLNPFLRDPEIKTRFRNQDLFLLSRQKNSDYELPIFKEDE